MILSLEWLWILWTWRFSCRWFTYVNLVIKSLCTSTIIILKSQDRVTQVTYCYLGLFFCLPCSVVIVLTVKSGIHRHVPGWEKKWWTRQQFKLSLPGFSFKVLYTKLCAAGIWTMQSYCHTPPNLKLSLISNFPLTGANLVSSRGWHSTKCNMLEERPG